MLSSDLNELIGGFTTWINFDKNIVNKAPSEKGAYVIRLDTAKKFFRLKGESDILYIGKSEGKKGLKQRFRSYIKPGRTQWTSQRINGMMQKYEMQISWLVSSEATNLETKLLKDYLNDHDELPPFNRVGSKRWTKTNAESIGLADSITLKLIKGKNY